ncbi:MAG: hypothetical protein JWL97_2993 [Gemmatimonadales bacterium]|nr:hypothetical protein [Gemmatimonadales bacterium]
MRRWLRWSRRKKLEPASRPLAIEYPDTPVPRTPLVEAIRLVCQKIDRSREAWVAFRAVRTKTSYTPEELRAAIAAVDHAASVLMGAIEELDVEIRINKERQAP